MTTWATEAEAIAAFGLDAGVEHCPSCHAEDDLTLEVTLPDGRVATICCTVAFLMPRHTVS